MLYVICVNVINSPFQNLTFSGFSPFGYPTFERKPIKGTLFDDLHQAELVALRLRKEYKVNPSICIL